MVLLANERRAIAASSSSLRNVAAVVVCHQYWLITNDNLVIQMSTSSCVESGTNLVPVMMLEKDTEHLLLSICIFYLCHIKVKLSFDTAEY